MISYIAMKDVEDSVEEVHRLFNITEMDMIEQIGRL